MTLGVDSSFQSSDEHYPLPSRRRLRVFAFDPQASLELDTAVINDAVIELPWEASWEDKLAAGPVNDYLEIVDFDSASGCFYPPVDLDHPHLLAQDGLAPSDGNPQFHQQMVFAVAMKTIRTFERALGRTVFWMHEPNHQESKNDKPGKTSRYREYVRRLRVYPHAMREANAYYSPQKAALLFGYFRGRPAKDGTGGEWVFTCLSQDIIAHETAHAILHGMWPRSIESCNCDALAFHEAFADIVALFQHFSARPIIEHQLARSGGSLRSANLLNGLAQQFGRATGRDGPLRFALKMLEEEEAALRDSKPLPPNRHADVTESHARGQILVAAVFDAFVTIFEQRTADLFRMTGRRRGDAEHMPTELVKRLAIEAEKTADQVLRMCIRGLDYLPPVDVTFGEYLRAIVTADADLIPVDERHYRVAFAEAFRKRGITVRGQRFSSPDSLIWEAPEPFATLRLESATGRRKGWKDSAEASFSDILKKLQLTVTFQPPHDKTLSEITRSFQPFVGALAYLKEQDIDDTRVNTRNLRDLAMLMVRYNQSQMQQWLVEPDPNDQEWEKLLGICLLSKSAPKSIYFNKGKKPAVEVASVRVSRRQGPDGQMLSQLIVQVTQRRRGYYSQDTQKSADEGKLPSTSREWLKPDFIFRGGATLFVDLNDGRVRRVIRKDIRNNERLDLQRKFLLGDPEAFTFAARASSASEPFAFMHRCGR